ncbi:hypothetical protein GOP47_0015229 [Adiantum capillus-veneris]|uniref:Uncharacterized protein n=1 Tax=Adiantum capillus-veneris TaxID=13818 RepID=A0A9D4UK82_ADICA|nr:hypothetical protein GOP47_0015229 [Adiantum capillus-veneris]
MEEPIDVEKAAYFDAPIPVHVTNETRSLCIAPLSIEAPLQLQATIVPNPINNITFNVVDDPSLIEIKPCVQPCSLYEVDQSSHVDAKGINLSIVPFGQSLLPRFLIADISNQVHDFVLRPRY